MVRRPVRSIRRSSCAATIRPSGRIGGKVDDTMVRTSELPGLGAATGAGAGSALATGAAASGSARGVFCRGLDATVSATVGSALDPAPLRRPRGAGFAASASSLAPSPASATLGLRARDARLGLTASSGSPAGTSPEHLRRLRRAERSPLPPRKSLGRHHPLRHPSRPFPRRRPAPRRPPRGCACRRACRDGASCARRPRKSSPKRRERRRPARRARRKRPNRPRSRRRRDRSRRRHEPTGRWQGRDGRLTRHGRVRRAGAGACGRLRSPRCSPSPSRCCCAGCSERAAVSSTASSSTSSTTPRLHPPRGPCRCRW